MKNRIIKTEKPDSFFTFLAGPGITGVLVVLIMLLSASSFITQDDTQKTDDLKQKKLDLLEKLENGSSLTAEDIRSSFSGSLSSDEIITGDEMREIHEKLSESAGEFRRAMESFRSSEEFMNFKEEFRRWSDEFKKEMEKMGDEINKSLKQGRSRTEVRMNYM